MAKPWADTPFELLRIPGTTGGPSCTNPGVMTVAISMANVHNMILRGLNSIYLQAPKLSLPADIADLMLYTKAWADTVHEHHLLEETLFFPQLEVLAKEAGEADGMMDSDVAQHHAFEPKLAETAAYVQEVMDRKKEFDCAVLTRLIDGFAPVLMEHLHDEIESLMRLEKCDGAKVEKAMDAVKAEGQKNVNVNLVIPLVLGCSDQEYPGGDSFPGVPFFIPWLSVYWFERKYRGSWRFNPCDAWGKPRPLHFL